MVPFIFFSFPAFVLYSVIISGQVVLGESFIIFIKGVFTGSSDYLGQSTGFSMFWFLPSLLGVVILQSYLYTLDGYIKVILIIFLGVSHFLISLVSKKYLNFLPLGMPVVIYTYLLSIIIVFLARLRTRWFMILCVFIYIIATFLSVFLKTSTEVGFVKVANINNLDILLLHDFMAIFGVLSVFYISGFFSKIRIIKLIGKNSLLIYLIHPFVYYFLKQCLQIWNPIIESIFLIFTVIVTFCISVFISLWLSQAIFKHKILKNLIVPGYFNEWLPIKVAMLSSNKK
jgi:fucose 4-O-acetylase-like acetyltransferase